jgi:hypothetical protein
MRRLVGIAAVLSATATLLASAPAPASSLGAPAPAPASARVAARHLDASTPACRAIAHRMGPTPLIDDDTLEGLRRSTRMGVRAEVDFAPTKNGLVAFHANRWEQGTDGVGRVWETTQAYAAGLTTVPNGQHVPSAVEVLKEAHDQRSLLLIELHHWAHWKPGFLVHLVRKIDQLDLWSRVWITGTRGALTALRALVDATVLWRLDGESALTFAAAQKLGVDQLAIWPGASATLIRSWRQAGYPVTARQSKPRAYGWAIRHSIRVVQTNTPALWLAYCAASSVVGGGSTSGRPAVTD